MPVEKRFASSHVDSPALQLLVPLKISVYPTWPPDACVAVGATGVAATVVDVVNVEAVVVAVVVGVVLASLS